VSGSGAIVVDDNGHQTIDCNNNYTALIHGHADAEILDAVRKTSSMGTAFGLPTAYEVEMAELLSARIGLPRWRFCNSGTEAVMMLIRAARAYTGRDLIVRFDGSYHGTYDGVVANDAPGVPTSTVEASLILPQNDSSALESVMRQNGRRVAAVLMDLMPNRAGLRPISAEFAALAQRLAAENGALLAIDEVITFRLAEGGLHTRYGLIPDLISLGKVIGGGFPVGAVGGRAAVLETFSPLGEGPVTWGGTFSANPVTMAAGLVALRRFTTSEIARLNAAGDVMRRVLQDGGLLVNGSGSLLRLVTDDSAHTWWRLYQAGVLAGSNGLLALSTAMSDEHLDAITERIVAALAARVRAR
jgi:glutamate-1-semialdehyde 2,1-aminomutase